MFFLSEQPDESTKRAILLACFHACRDSKRWLQHEG